jgi:hypothetical protein
MTLAVQASDAVPWVIGASVALAAWAALLGAVLVATRPRVPSPGPETLEPGPEPPAVANMLVNGFRVTTSALSATVVDLAARDHLAIEVIGGGQQLIRLRAGPDDAINAPEKLALGLVRSRAHGDSVPATELSLGYGSEAAAWWKRFERSVADDARGRRLARERFTAAQGVMLAGALAVPIALAAVAAEVLSAAARADGEGPDAGTGAVFAAFAWVVLAGLGRSRLGGLRETPGGAAAAARWLGVRNRLRRERAFERHPAAGVVVWDRLLAHAVALGAAHDVDESLPLGPTRYDEGWGPYTGLWRQVRIRYPSRFAYGQPPVRATLVSLAVLAGAVAGAVLFARTLLPAVIDLAGLASEGGLPGVAAVPVLILVGWPLVFLGGLIVYRAIVLIRAVPDLGKTVTFEGYVVRVPPVVDSRRRGKGLPAAYVAVDNGTGDEVVALRHDGGGVREGDIVRATITPRLRHVVWLERLMTPAFSAFTHREP